MQQTELAIVKSEHIRTSSAVTFHDKEDESANFDDFHNENEDYGHDDEEFDASGDYEDINPPMSDDDDEDGSNENDPDFDGSGARFECDECSKAFAKRSRLVAHKAEHRNERLYTCPRTGCNSAFNVPHRLTRHLRNVHDADEEEINEVSLSEWYFISFIEN